MSSKPNDETYVSDSKIHAHFKLYKERKCRGQGSGKLWRRHTKINYTIFKRILQLYLLKKRQTPEPWLQPARIYLCSVRATLISTLGE